MFWNAGSDLAMGMEVIYLENKVIRLALGDWSWNASVAGFINIIGEENVTYDGASAQIPVNCLEDFEDRYFRYFIDTYEKTLPWYRIVSFKNTIGFYNENGFEGLDLKKLKSINDYIKDTVKRYLTSNSFKSAFELMGEAGRMAELEKNLSKVREPKDDTDFEKVKEEVIGELKKQFEIINKIIEYCGNENGRRFIGAKNVIYTIIRNGWNGVSFLNPQTKIKDIYEDYRTYFVDEAREYLAADKQKFRYKCFTCGAPIRDMNNDMSFLNQSGFDTARKPSHVWDFVNDIALCPVCKLIYSCLPAGFVYVNNTGLYINANVNMRYNVRVNRSARDSVLKEGRNETASRRIYRVLVEAMERERIEKSRYELADVQVVRYENERFKFNLLPESTIKLIHKYHDEISGLIRTGYKEGKESYSIYEQVLENIFNNQNLFLLVYKLLHFKTASNKDCFFHMGHVEDILSINAGLIKSLGGMENMDENRNYINEAKNSGYHLRKAFMKNNEKTGKIPGISYRLLNALKTGNRNMFMDVLLNSYLYTGNKVPAVISEIFRSDELFSTIGYSFVTGFIAERSDDSGNEANNEKTVNGEEN
jgi:CRISPR-associated protein Cst1